MQNSPDFHNFTRVWCILISHPVQLVGDLSWKYNHYLYVPCNFSPLSLPLTETVCFESPFNCCLSVDQLQYVAYHTPRSENLYFYVGDCHARQYEILSSCLLASRHILNSLSQLVWVNSHRNIFLVDVDQYYNFIPHCTHLPFSTSSVSIPRHTVALDSASH